MYFVNLKAVFADMNKTTVIGDNLCNDLYNFFTTSMFSEPGCNTGTFFSSEFEPIDTKKEDFIKNDLINGFDQQLVITTRLRKTGPHTMKSHMKKIIRPELKYLVLYQFIIVPLLSLNKKCYIPR